MEICVKIQLCAYQLTMRQVTLITHASVLPDSRETCVRKALMTAWMTFVVMEVFAQMDTWLTSAHVHKVGLGIDVSLRLRHAWDWLVGPQTCASLEMT